MKVNITKEWFDSRIMSEEGHEIGAGNPENPVTVPLEPRPDLGPIFQDQRPNWPHRSGGLWAKGKDSEWRTVWV